MTNLKPKKIKKLIVDTEQFAESFTDDMCAYVTGQIGDIDEDYENNPSKDIADKYSKEIKYLNWWNEHILKLREDSECLMYPSSMEPTQGWFNNGFGNHYKDTPENEAIAVQEALSIYKHYAQQDIEEVQRRLAENDFENTQYGWTKEACAESLKNYNEDLKRLSVVQKHSAYQSVIIFVDEFPPQEVWEEFIQRAKYFALNREEIIGRITLKTIINITDFRKSEGEYKEIE